MCVPGWVRAGERRNAEYVLELEAVVMSLEGPLRSKQPVPQRMHEPTFVALLLLFWNKDFVFCIQPTDKQRGKLGF